MNADAIAKYIDRGTHHCGWDDSDNGSIQHVALCTQLSTIYPALVPSMRNVIDISDAQIDALLNQCAAIEVHPKFTPERIEFVGALIKARRARLETAFGG